MKVHFTLHLGSPVTYDAITGQWSPLEKELAVPDALPVLWRIKALLSRGHTWPPDPDLTRTVAAQCGVLETRVRRRVRRAYMVAPDLAAD